MTRYWWSRSEFAGSLGRLSPVDAAAAAAALIVESVPQEPAEGQLYLNSAGGVEIFFAV